MIQFDVLELKRSRYKTNYDVFTDSQDLTGHKKESRGTLDDFLDKIDIQTIRTGDEGVAFHIRTKPIKAKKRWWKRFVPSFGIWRYLKEAWFEKTIDGYFGIDTEGMKSRVIEHQTKGGAILDIFGNVEDGSFFEIMQKSYHNINEGGFLRKLLRSFVTQSSANEDSLAYSREYTTPHQKSTVHDEGRKRREITKSLEKVAAVYEKLGIPDGRLVLSPTLEPRNIHLTSDLSMEIKESDEFRNCTFYDVTLLERGERIPSVPKEDSGIRKTRVIKKGKNRSDGKDKEDSKSDEDILFKDVVGIDTAIAKLKNVRTYFDNPQRFREERGYGLSPGCILYGPPGTGKTMLAKAFANETKAPIIVYKASEILSKYVGDSDKNLSTLFEEAEEQARKEGKCVIFIDEFEQIARKRGSDNHELSNRLVDNLLTYLDGFSERGDVYLIAATNMIDEIDTALRNSQGGRLDEIEIPLPNYEGRRKMVSDAVKRLKQKAKYFPFEDLDYDAIARASEGISGRLLVGQSQSVLRTLADRYHDARESNPNTPKATNQNWLDEIRKYRPEDRKIGFRR